MEVEKICYGTVCQAVSDVGEGSTDDASNANSFGTMPASP